MSDNAKTKSAWNDLNSHARSTLAQLCGADPDRAAKLSQRLEFDLGEMGPVGMRLDWSKTHLDDALLGIFETLADASGFGAARAALHKQACAAAMQAKSCG